MVVSGRSFDLSAAVAAGNDDAIVAMIREASDPGVPQRPSAQDVRTLLVDTRSNRVRNAAAVALADLRADGAAEDIVTLLRSPAAASSAGTLLFALDELGASLPLDVLLTIIEHGSYEARSEALSFLAEHRLAVEDDADLVDIRDRLDALASAPDPDTSRAATEARERLRPYLDRGRSPGTSP